MESASMILRASIFEPLITKGEELTFENLDGNFIKIFQDLNTLFGSVIQKPFVDVVSGAEITGVTTETLLNAVTLTDFGQVYPMLKGLQDGLLQFTVRIKASASNSTIKMYLSSEPFVNGSSMLLATSPVIGADNYNFLLKREIKSASNLTLLDPTAEVFDDVNPQSYGLGVFSGWEFADMYLIFTCDNGSTEDTIQYISSSIIPLL